MKALYVHKFVFGSAWWIEFPMYVITLRLSKNKNPLFYAMYGLSIPFLPKAMNAFFSQKELAESIITGHENDVNPVLGEAIEDLYAQSKRIEDGT